MEWVRTCFRTKFRLHADPSILTPGRWVRCPPDTPHFVGFHHFGSRDWTTEERFPWPALGEYEGPRVYDSGARPVTYPALDLVGDTSALARAQRNVVALPLVYGFDSRCYANPLGVPPETIVLTDISQRSIMTRIASFQDLLYTDAAAAAVALQAYMGPDATVSFVADDPSSAIPGSLIGISPREQIVIISGTTTQAQLVFQLLYGIVGVVDYGRYATIAQWQIAADAITTRMNAAGVDLSKPIVLVGHSYGGAVASLIAASIRFSHPTADVSLLTFGAPLPGDQRVADLLRPIRQIHLATTTDPVPASPPTGVWLLPFFLLAPAPLYNRWALVSGDRPITLLDPSGLMVEGQPWIVSFPILSDLATTAIAGAGYPSLPGHEIKYYLQLLAAVP